MTGPGAARERFVAEAGRLFATRGYARTSVADVQVACGLTPGSGALYKHFPSKRALLEAVVDTHVTTMRDGARWFVDDLPHERPDALRATAHAVLAGVRRDGDAVRVMLRDLDDEPELRERLWAEIRSRVYGPFTAWIAEAADPGSAAAADSEAVGTVLVAALTCAPILEVLMDRAPGDLDLDRFVDGWVRTALAVLGDGPHADGPLTGDPVRGAPSPG